MSTSRTFRVGAVVVLALGAVSACGGGGSGDSKGPIKIAGTASLSGTFASSGTNVANGYKLAVKQINADGGVLGRKIELTLKDDKSDAGLVTRQYNEFLSRDKVDALVSPYGSPLAGPAGQLADRNKTPIVHSQSSSPAVFKGSSYNLMAGIGPSFGVFAELPAFAASQKLTKLTLVHNDLATYAEQCDGVEDAMKKAGVTLVSRYKYAAATTDFSSIALKVKKDAPQFVVECSAIQDSIGITRALDQQGFTPKAIATPTGVDAAYAKSLGKLADNVFAYSAWAPELDLAGSKDFAEAYKKEYGADANTQSAGGYAAVEALAAAIEKAGSADKEKVNDALHDDTFKTILGEYKVDKNGVQTGYSAIILQNQAGSFKIVWPKSDASVAPVLPGR